tara:strand:+ start:103 stop:1587 length:1485 start_codon:yes stop_codon:yes gene_type:complete
MNLKNKNIGILGLGLSGYWAAKLAKSMGANVFISELNKKNLYEKEIEQMDIDLEIGQHSDKILNCDFIIKSPGIPNNSEIVKKIRANGIQTMGEMEFAYQNSNIKIIAVTGTNGKTTVVTALYDILEQKLNVLKGGNIGTPFSQLVLENNLLKDHNFDYAVLEVSSYQSEDFEDFKPKLAIILNCSEDHVKEHGGYKNYLNAKLKLFKNMNSEDYAIYNSAVEDLFSQFEKMKNRTNVIPYSLSHDPESMYYFDGPNILKTSEDNKVRLWPSKVDALKYGTSREPQDFFCINQGQLIINGITDIENFIAVATACSILGISDEQIKKGIKNFKGLEHRFEIFKKIDNEKIQLTFINDSKSTNGHSLQSALSNCSDVHDGYDNIALILGGRSKKINYSDYMNFRLNRTYLRVIAYGEAAEEIKDNLLSETDQNGCQPGIIDIFEKFDDAVKRAIDIANDFKYGAVLLSPACSSFDQFDSFEHRGNVFKDIVEEYYS